VVKIHSAHEQGPVAQFRPQASKWTVRRAAPRATALHDAGFDVVAPREREQLARIEHAFEARQRAAHVKRAFLPVAAKEFARRQAAEQILFHRPIICSA